MEMTNAYIQFYWDKLKMLFQRYSILWIFLFLYITFISLWEDLIEKYLINCFFCYFEKNIICDIIFLSFSLYCIINFVLSKAKGCSQSVFSFCITSFVLWLYYRFFSDRFYLLPLTTIDTIKYVDAIAIFDVCVFLRIITKIQNKTFIFSDGFAKDIPIMQDDEDIFGRSIFAHDAVDKILRTDTTSEAFSFGVVSPWGMGKTSFMNLMKNWIEKNYSNECVTIDFNPWLYSNNANIIHLFLNELSNSLKQYDSTLANGIMDYSRALSTIGTTETKIASTILDLISHPTKLEDKVDLIKQSIKRIRKKIIVFIDDIDRLDSNELVEMLKLIRNVSNFPYMYFIVAYDKDYLLECLKNKMPTKELDFTEKIFQVEFHIPQCTKTTLKEYIYTSVSNLVDEKEREEMYDAIYGISILKGNIINSISSIREAKRIINSFHTSYSKLKGEINACDMFFIELLKNKYPTIYAVLEKDRNAVLINAGYNTYELYNGENSYNESDYLFIDKPYKYILKDYINGNKTLLHIKDTDIRNIENILDALFPHSFTAHNKGVNDIHYTDRYFNISLLESDISDLEFEKVLKYDVENIKPIFKEWAVNKSIALSAKIERIHIDNKDDLKKYIRILLYSETILPFYQRNCTLITNSINRIGDYNKGKKPSKEDIDFIKKALCENGYSYGLCEYLRSVAFEDNIWEYPISREEMNSIRHIIFKDCLDNNNDTKTVIDAFYGTADVVWNNGERKYSYLQKNRELMRDFAKSHFVNYIYYTISYYRPNPNHEYKLNTFPLTLWESWDYYLSYVMSIKDKDPAIIEYLTFIGKCKEKNYEDYVNFTFEHIKLDES